MTETVAAGVRPALDPHHRLGVIGAGAMGRSLLRGMLLSGVASEQVWAATKSPGSARAVADEFGIRVEVDYRAVVAETDVVLLAVKPAQLDAVLATLVESGLRAETLVVSVAAGSAATSEHLAIATRIFEAAGKCITIDERHMNAVTAISGSGPAYIYLVIEALADAGVRIGLPRDVALALVAQTVLGAAAMVQSGDRHPAALKDDVTTPAGCTIGALLVLEDGKIRSTLARAVEEAYAILRGFD